MSKKPKKKVIKTRDYLMKRLIEGATKSGVHKDHKKDKNKYASRQKVKIEKCRQCSYPIRPRDDMEDFEIDGFCSLTCFDYFTTGE
jgi:hypothetical protein